MTGFENTTCEKCGNGTMRLRKGQFGSFLGCSNYPKCKNTINLGNGRRPTKQTTTVKRELKRIPNPTPQQQAVFDAVVAIIENGDYEGFRNLIIKATAGSGKTTLLEHIIVMLNEIAPMMEVLYCTFDKRSQTEAIEKGLPARTIHSKSLQDYRIWYRAKTGEDVVIEDNKVYNIIKAIMQDYWGKDWYKEYGKAIAPIKQLIEKCKVYGIKELDVTDAMAYMLEFGILAPGLENIVAMVASESLKKNNEQLGLIDQSDMVYLPYILNIPVQQIDIIVLDEVQDLSHVMIVQILKSVRSYIFSVGDSDQAIYAFRGADREAMKNVEEVTGAYRMPLTVSFRCAKEHQRIVNELLPHIDFEVFEKNVDGAIYSTDMASFLDEVEDGDLVMCPVNADLVKPAMELLRRGRKAIILGREIGYSIKAFMLRFSDGDGMKIEDCFLRIEDWMLTEIQKLTALDKMSQVERLRDNYDTLWALSDGLKTVKQVADRIDEIFSDDRLGVSFATIHKSKGNEAPNTYLLSWSKLSLFTDNMIEMMFVMLTRSKNKMVWVDEPCPVPETPREELILQLPVAQ